MRARRPQGENDPSPDINFSRVSVSGTVAGWLVTPVILGIVSPACRQRAGFW